MPRAANENSGHEEGGIQGPLGRMQRKSRRAVRRHPAVGKGSKKGVKGYFSGYYMIFTKGCTYWADPPRLVTLRK